MTFEKGSLILIDYTAKIKDTDQIFESTIEKEAKNHKIYDPSITYTPKLISVGESWVLKGLDEALANTSVGDKLTIEITPDKGFGQRDPGKVRMIPLRKLGDDAEKVSVGDSIELDGKKGVIRYIGSGRVQIDYNHKCAGKIIVYDVNVIKALESDDDKIEGILKKHLPAQDWKLQFEKTENNLDIFISEKLFRTDGLQMIKHFIQLDIFKFIPTLDKVSFTETFESKTKKNPPKDSDEQEQSD